MTGRLMVEVLRSTVASGLSPTSANLAAQAYKSVFFQINESLVGPYSNACREDVIFPCFCNIGVRSLYSVRVNGTTGRVQHIPRDDPDAAVSFSTANLGICMLDLSSIDAPLNILIPVFAANANSSLSLDLRRAVIAAFSVANDNGLLAGVGKLRPIFVSVDNTSNLTVFFASTARRYLPLAVFGSDVSSVSSGIPSLLEDYDKMQLADPPITSPALFNMFALQLVPVVADYIHLQAMYASHAMPSKPAVVVAETADQLQFAVKSFNTFGRSPVQGIFAQHDAAQASLDAVFSKSALSMLTNSTEGSVVIVVSENETIFRRVISMLVLSAVAFPLNRVVALLACDEQFVYNLMTSGQAVPAGLGLILASSLPKWWMGNATAASPTAARVQLASTALVTVTRTLQNGHNPEQLMQSIYASKTLLTGLETLGPFYSAACDEATIQHQLVSRLCQCTKGPRGFYAFAYNVNATDASSTPFATSLFSYSMQTCGVQYVPLPTQPAASFFTTGAIVGIAVGSSGLFVGLCIVAVCCSMSLLFRNNRDAPKDGQSVTIVFTDIQSSTQLWARLPQQMAQCVVQHHSVIRRCVAKHRGYEVKTVGDSFMVAFVDACDAVRFALKIQDDLLGADWPKDIDAVYEEIWAEKERATATGGIAVDAPLVAASSSPGSAYMSVWGGLRVRVGINTGPCDVVFDEVTKGFDYYGTTVNTAARVEAVGHGGQVIASKATYDALCAAGYDFSTTDVKDCGACPLRGLDTDTVLYQLLPASLKGRGFGPLRLDVDSSALVEEIHDAAADKLSSSCSASERSSQHEAPQHRLETFLERIARRFSRASNGSVTIATIFDRYQFVQMVLSTCPVKFRQDVTAYLREKWSVPAHTTKASSLLTGKESDEDVMAMELMSVLAKVCAASNAKQQIRSRLSSTAMPNDNELCSGL